MPQHPLFHISRGTDSYKFSHHKLYPPNTTLVSSYMVPRKAPSRWSGKAIVLGTQYVLLRYLVGKVVDHPQVTLSKERVEKHFGRTDVFNEVGWRHIVDKHHGRLPLSIRTLPEGTIVPVGTPTMTVEATDPACFWLTSWVEDVLLHPWNMSTVATNGWECKKLLRRALELSGDVAGLNYKWNDFGLRGCGGIEEAATAGTGHLANFFGTDNFPALDLITDYYGLDMAGSSIPASEHSTIAAWGRDGELAAFKNELDMYPEGLIACVSDTYDIWDACRNKWGGVLKEQVLNRNGTLVVRPDSGPLPETILGVLETLGEAFGTVTNQLGFKLLPPQVRVIQGDGMDRAMLEVILNEMMAKDWSIDNIAFGSGGGNLRAFTRDTLGYAFKASYVEVDGVGRGIYKDPITDPGKASYMGRVSVLLDQKGVPQLTPFSENNFNDLLVETFRDGKMLGVQTFEEIRNRIEQMT